MHVILDIQVVDALDRQQQLQGEGAAHRPAETTPLRTRMAFVPQRAQTRTETALARRRAGELVTQRG